MYVILYLPDDAEPEVFGTYADPITAANALRQIAIAADRALHAEQSGVLATVNLTINGERHRYQLLKLASPVQLGIHADVIDEERQAGNVEGEVQQPAPPSGRLSGY